MSGRATDSEVSRAVETCQIVWWCGYITGRFQAVGADSSELPRLIAQSRPIRWRSSTPPGPTESAVAALESLKARLFDAGWTVAATDEESWFGLALARPISIGAYSFEAAFEDTIEDRDSTAERQLHIDSALIAQLRSELEKANRETEAQRRYRLEAEAEAAQRVRSPMAAPAPRSTNRWPLLLLAYPTAILGTAAISYLAFHSVYAVLVAALTSVALAVTVDSWFIARRHTVRTP
jgi:hypothetical protein